MNQAAEIASRYIATWNENNATHRDAMLHESWAEDVTYVDPLAKCNGRSEISALIDAVHARFPGLRFSLRGTADGYEDRVRFSWALGSEEDAGSIHGTDFAILENGQLKTVTGFIDKLPS